MFRRLALIAIVVLAAVIFVLLLTTGRRFPSRTAVPPPADLAEQASPETPYRVRGWELPRYDPETGERLWVMSAAEAVAYRDGTVDVTDPVIEFTGRPGRPLTVTAPKGKVDTKQESGVLLAVGDRPVRIVMVDPEEAMSVEAEELHWRDPQKQVTAVGAILMRVGEAEIRGRNLRSERAMTYFVIPEEVRVVLAGARAALLGAPGEAGGPLEITCAGELHFDRSTGQATFYDTVRLAQGPRLLLCDVFQVSLAQDADGRTQVSWAQARADEGRRVTLIEAEAPGAPPTRKITGTSAEYDARANTLTITGPVEAQVPGWHVTGERVIVEEAGRRTTVQGAPAVAQGDEDRLEASAIVLDQSQDPAVLIARGEPAHAYRGPNELLTPELHLVQKTGALTVPAPGQLRWQSQQGFSGVASGAPPEPSETPGQRTIDVAWSRSMTFADRRAHFEGAVRAREQTTTLTADRMDILFDEALSAVQELTAWDSVVVEDPPWKIWATQVSFDIGGGVMRVVGTASDPGRLRLDRDELRAPTIVFQQKTGALETDGPGSFLYHSGAGTSAIPVEVAWQTRMTYDEEARVARFQEGVEATRKSMTLTSDRLALFFDSSQPGSGLGASLRVDRAEASGRVLVTQTPAAGGPPLQGSGHTMTWDAGKGTTTLTGDPARMWQQQNVIRCLHITYHDQEHELTSSGAGRLIVYAEGIDPHEPPEGSQWEKVTINWQQGVRYDTLAREANFQGDVLVREAARTLYARDALTAYFSQDDRIALQRAVAQGPAVGDVTVTEGTLTGLGTWFQWDAASEVVELRGSPYALIRQGANEVQVRAFRFDKELAGRAEHLHLEGTGFIDFLEW